MWAENPSESKSVLPTLFIMWEDTYADKKQQQKYHCDVRCDVVMPQGESPNSVGTLNFSFNVAAV